jgi:HEAT repeat protein/photosystem II stability/assembly factor-like uncharacterized protein
MNGKRKLNRTVRWVLSVMLIALGLSATWAWGQVASLAGPVSESPSPQPAALYAAWQPEGLAQAELFRSADKGATWQPLTLPQAGAPAAWAYDGGDQLAVAVGGGPLFVSKDRGDTWTTAGDGWPILSLAWSQDGVLYAGTNQKGIYRLASDGSLTAMRSAPAELAVAAVQHLTSAGNRLFAATPSVLFYTDDGGQTWVKSMPAPGPISALAAADRVTVYVGTETSAVYKSSDAGRTWQPAMAGLGLAAGQMVKITALQADPDQPGVLYAAVAYAVGSTQVHLSAEGVFMTLDGGDSWQALAGPTFPAAAQASELVPLPDRTLSVLAVNANGFQSYAPDTASALAALGSSDPAARAAAARLLGLAKAKEASDALLAALADPDPGVSRTAADALGRIADPANSSALLVMIEHPDEQVRLGAARALALMTSEAAVEPLRAMLMNGQGAEVTVGAQGLGQIGTPAAIDALLAALFDAEMSPRRHAALGALEAMGEPAVGPLSKLLTSSRDANARQNSAEALGWIGSSQATQALVDALQDRSEAVRGTAAWALGEIGDPAARAALERAVEGDGSVVVQVEAQQALSQLAEKPSIAVDRAAPWPLILSRLQPMRWLILGMSVAGAAWLAWGNRRLVPSPIGQQADCQGQGRA